MAGKGNVIDLTARLRKGNKSKKEQPSALASAAPVLDMTERRQEILQSERRIAKRTILTEFLGAFIVVPQKGLVKANLYDISDTGVSFDVDFENGELILSQEVSVRFYLSQSSYFSFDVVIANIRAIAGEGVIRHGGTFANALESDPALTHFIRFIEHVSQQLRVDRGDLVAPRVK
ncbi:MAG: PilZ domain-containing protein [Bdellovibrionales bacterium CG10_big_fil_rev_8_21_14_0_10_45_34]|nr:MAG: PilZ domain-containing protein [Bdellovibrionales bacterium CG10_big_fil_rev_8_21_14_0_10_45_34]